MAARRGKRRPKPRPLLPDGLTIRFGGPPGCGKTTAMQAVRLLLEDAGARVVVGIERRACEDGEQNLLVAETSPAVLAELRDWIADVPA